MGSYATILYFSALFALMFLYTVTWDIYTGFFAMLQQIPGINSTVLGYMYTIHEWIPAALFLSLTFWYIAQAQARGAGA
jgi:hypothetical protein